MTTSAIVGIVAAVVVAVVLIAIAFFAIRARRERRRAEAGRIREQAREDTAKLEHREALGQETAAKARAAQAEADAKAAEAARLQEHADGHQSQATAARGQVNARLQHADHLDPGTRKAKDKAEDRGRKDEPHQKAGRSNTAEVGETEDTPGPAGGDGQAIGEEGAATNEEAR
jgi:MFS superfamily sulfate permease-like transporter